MVEFGGVKNDKSDYLKCILMIVFQLRAMPMGGVTPRLRKETTVQHKSQKKNRRKAEIRVERCVKICDRYSLMWRGGVWLG